MKIHIIFTGGTIGSCEKNGFISTDANAKCSILERSKERFSDIDFSTSEPYTILSENLSAENLNLLQRKIDLALKDGYDGIIVTHGTDTLHYTACALEYAFGASNIPIVLVSAAFVPEDARSNAFDNFCGAVEFIKSGISGGVFVSYKNQNDDHTLIHLPSRMLQHSEKCADIFSISDAYVAKIGENGIEKGELPYRMVSAGVVDYSDDSGILVIDSHPCDGFRYSLDGIRAVILKPYHSATLDTQNEKLKSFSRSAMRKGIPVFVVNAYEGPNYESTKKFAPFGIIPLQGTYISSFMSLWAKFSIDGKLF